jgi:hypothetical protein
MLTRSLSAIGAVIALAWLAQSEAAWAQGAPPTIVPNIGSTTLYDLYYRGHERQEDLISCSEGRRIVRRAGYDSVTSLRCSDGVYRYRRIRRGYSWRITVDAGSGFIVGARKIRAIQ